MLSAAAWDMLARQIKISGLPSQTQLQHTRALGFRHLINVSGAESASLYPTSVLRHFQIHQPAPFRDVFSAFQGDSATVADYLTHSESHEREAFYSAVLRLRTLLQRGNRCYIFCRLGEGRSPTVTMAVLHLHWRIPLVTAAHLVRQLRPVAKLSGLSYAAASWAALLPTPLSFHQEFPSHASLRGFSARLDRAATPH